MRHRPGGVLQRSLAAPRRTAFARVDLLSQAPGTAPIFPQARYAAGFAALESGDYDAALAAFAQAVNSDPLLSGSAEDRSRDRRRGGGAARRTDRRRACSCFRARPRSRPNLRRSIVCLASSFWIDEQAGKSIEHLRTAIRLAPSDERARVLLSDVLAQDRGSPKPSANCTLAADAGLRSGHVAYRLAQLYQRQSLLPPAAKAFADSESFGPIAGRDRFYQTWGSLLVNQADFDGAVVAYQKRIDVNANGAEPHRQLGEIYFLQGRDEEALAEFHVAAWLDPKDSKAHAAAGQATPGSRNGRRRSPLSSAPSRSTAAFVRRAIRSAPC